MNDSIIFQSPAIRAEQLFLLFHGVGAAPSSMQAFADPLCQAFPHSMVVGVAAPEPYGDGRAWFSLDGITEDNRPVRVAKALPTFRDAVQHWQAQANVPPERTALIGFSQGAIMALAAGSLPAPLAGRIVAHSGRFAVLPKVMPANITVHLIHGKDDHIIPYRHCIEAAQALEALGADFTADVLPFLAHSVNEASLAVMMQALQAHIPKRLWEAALAAARLQGLTTPSST